MSTAEEFFGVVPESPTERVLIGVITSMIDLIVWLARVLGRGMSALGV